MKQHPIRVTSMATLSGLVAFSWLFTGATPSEPEQRSPQAILVLGGSPDREKFAAQFAHTYPDLPIWISGGSPEEYAMYVFEQARIKRDRIHLDYRAVDTVTNFTTLVDDFKTNNITDIYVITSDYHMPRAKVIGSIVLGSRGITMHPVTIPSQAKPEISEKSVRDGLRSVIWMLTGSALQRD